MVLIGFDFSINKPAACILKGNQYHFISWPYGLSKPQRKVYEDAPITIVDRSDTKDKGDNVSEKLRYEVKNSKYLANLILDKIFPYIEKEKERNVFVAFEGLSYGSTGDVVLQLGGYKYILMDVLRQFIPLDNMFTYAPTTIKKTAGCSKKGMGKPEMIEAFKKVNTPFSKHLRDNEGSFKTRFGNWITHLDDVSDSYWVVETLKKKEFG